MSKIILFGKIPPPIGGVTVFNARKIKSLELDGYNVVNVKPSIYGLLLLLFHGYDRDVTVLLSSSNIVTFVIIIVYGLCSTTEFYDHNSSRTFSCENIIYKYIRRYAISRFRRIVLVNDRLKRNYSNYPFYSKLSFRVEIPFLVPDASDDERIVQKYPSEVKNHLALNYRSIVIASAFKPNLGLEGEDIYSLNETIECFTQLAKMYSNILFVIAIGSFDDTAFSKHIFNSLSEASLNNKNLVAITSGVDIWPLFKKSIVLLRPTTTDGDSLSVREALHFGSSVIATDVVERPEGVILYDASSKPIKTVLDNFLRNHV